MDNDSQPIDSQMDGMQNGPEEGEEIEVTRDELIIAMQEVVNDLSAGLKGPDRESYLSADDLAQNDWFFAGISDRPDQYSVTMWPAEGDEDMLRIDIGGEDDVHALAANSEQIATLTDDFIDGMDDFDEDEFEEYDEEEEDLEDEDEDIEEDEEMVEEDEEGVSQNGNSPRR